MTGYLILNIEVRDADAYQSYRQQAEPIVTRFGGRYLIRGGGIQNLEGKPGFKRLVVVEFPSIEEARRFYNSPDYQPVKQIRLRSAVSDVALVTGWSP